MKNVMSFIRAQPHNYQRFGVYWWSVKQMLRDEGFNVGNYDDPDKRREVEAQFKTKAELKTAAFTQLEVSAQQLQHDEHDGYRLHDEDWSTWR